MTTPKATPRMTPEQVLEEAAKVCDQYARDGRLSKEYACETADELAARIRSINLAYVRLAALGSEGPVTPPAPREAICPICGKSPITLSCVRDWLKVSGHPLHSEWQERMIQYANEIARSNAQDDPSVQKEQGK
jgi:hypothetical protein